VADRGAQLRDVASTLRATNDYRREVLIDRRRLIRDARSAGMTWPEIAQHLGVTVRAVLKAAR